MKKYDIESITLDFIAGTDIEEASKLAIDLAKELDVKGPVKFRFNYANMEAYSFSTVEYLVKIYNYLLGVKDDAV